MAADRAVCGELIGYHRGAIAYPVASRAAYASIGSAEWLILDMQPVLGTNYLHTENIRAKAGGNGAMGDRTQQKENSW